MQTIAVILREGHNLSTEVRVRSCLLFNDGKASISIVNTVM